MLTGVYNKDMREFIDIVVRWSETELGVLICFIAAFIIIGAIVVKKLMP